MIHNYKTGADQFKAKISDLKTVDVIIEYFVIFCRDETIDQSCGYVLDFQYDILLESVKLNIPSKYDLLIINTINQKLHNARFYISVHKSDQLDKILDVYKNRKV